MPLPTDAWKEVTPDIVNTPDNRGASAYLAAVKQFDVEHHPRYKRNEHGATMCNIFLWDATKATSCEIPHWVDPATGVEVPMGKGKELSANGVCDWLGVHGIEHGWMQCGELQARSRASAGYPTVVAWKNPGGIGHVGMILPGADFTHLAQAGASNFFDKPLASGFGSVRPLFFYTHD